MTTRITCTECGWRSNPCRSQAQAAYALRRHSCAKERARQAAHRRGRARKAAIDRTPKPCLHKVAEHRHGTRACYVLDKCRCEPCAAANAATERQRARLSAYGRWQPYVDAAPTRAHVEKLRAAGMGLKQVAAVSGVPHGGIAKLMYGEPRRGLAPSKRIRWETAIRLQAVHATIDTLAGGARIDPTGTRRRVQALVALGWSQSQLCARIGMTASNFGHTLENASIQARTARTVAALYDELWDTPPPEAEHREKIAASRARRYAAARGWTPPLAWADTDIDDPAAHPNATGYDPERVVAVMAGALVDGDDDSLDLALALTRVDRLECLRRGHLDYPGHSDTQVCARLGLDAKQMQADKAAERAGRRERAAAELDEIAVALIVDGTLRIPLRASSPELVEAVRRLAARGLNDTQIAERIGRDKDAVLKIRTRNAIPTPPRAGTAQQIDGIAARHGASGAATRNTPEDRPAA